MHTSISIVNNKCENIALIMSEYVSYGIVVRHAGRSIQWPEIVRRLSGGGRSSFVHRRLLFLAPQQENCD
jgi:hypothetical protein